MRDAIRSILDQQDDRVEVIAVDDASNDGTRACLSEFGDSIRLVLHDERKGAGVARNAGAAVAIGDYLMFLDGDDAFVPWAVDVYATIVEARQPIVIIGPMRWFEGRPPDPGPPPSNIRFFEFADYFSKDRSVGVSASALVVDRRSFEQVHGWDQRFLAEDVDLLWRLGVVGSVIQITEPVTTFHRSHAGQSIRQTEGMLEAISRLAEKERTGRYPGGTSRRLERRAAIGGVVFHWTRLALRKRSFRQAMRFVVANRTFVRAAIVVRLRHRFRPDRPLHTIALTTRAPNTA